MALDFWWLGHTTSSSVRVCARCTTTGPVVFTLNGLSQIVTADTTVKDGSVYADFTNLTPGTAYPLSITQAGGTLSGSATTFRTTAASIAVTSCWTRYGSYDHMVDAILRYGAEMMAHQGDYIYMSERPGSMWGEATAPLISGSSTLADYLVHWRQCKRRNDMRTLERAIPNYYIADDHEWGGDNWDHTVTQAQSALNVAPGGTQAEVDAAWWLGRQACMSYHLGNPPNTDVAAYGDKPSAAGAGTPASQYPVVYFPHTAGPVELLHIDCFSYRSPLTDTDNASKTMLGATQKAWLKARLSASKSPFKLIMSGKATYRAAAGAFGAGDSWLKYTTERDELISYIQAQGITGVIWMTGDEHGAHVTYIESTGHISVCANPAGVVHIQQATGYPVGCIWKEQGHTPNANMRLPAAVFGLVEATMTQAKVSIINEYGTPLWVGYVDAGSNVLRSM